MFFLRYPFKAHLTAKKFMQEAAPFMGIKKDILANVLTMYEHKYEAAIKELKKENEA